MQNDITISLAQVLWIVGGVTALGAFIKWVSTPFKRIDDHGTDKLREVRDEYQNEIINHHI